MASIAIGQVQRGADDDGVKTDVIPRAALLTERGRQLADQLRVLRRAEASMGLKHPNLGAVQKQIEEIKEQLEAWAPGSDSKPGEDAAADAVPKMNEKDLKQLVLRMSAKIERLERRVDALERRLEIF